MIIIAEIIAWAATCFRGLGMLSNNAELVKYLVSCGNLLWMINGIIMHNVPLITSNTICLIIMLIDIIKIHYGKK